ncbi:hypothetical protein PV327_011227, partial [Microctonus hyperodae]
NICAYIITRSSEKAFSELLEHLEHFQILKCLRHRNSELSEQLFRNCFRPFSDQKFRLGRSESSESRVPKKRLNYKWDYKQTSSRQKLQGLDFYSAVVAHVITLFNGVDMLYSKLKNTKIQINIAGIVIGSEQNSFDFLKKCFVKPAHGEIAMDAQCAMTEFDFYIKARERLIPTGSYDFIVFLTNNDIVKVSKNVFTKRTSYTSVGGLATIHDDFYEKILKRGTNVKPIAIIGEKGYFDIFRNVAHEIGHLMTLLHDEPPYLTEDIKCCGYIMKPKSSECEHCLSWSSTSEETLRLFFR